MNRQIFRLIAMGVFAGIAAVFSAETCGGSASGEVFSKHSIPLNEIREGGPPKDGIPALFDPEFTSAKDTTFLGPQDRILGIERNGKAKAYPIRILNWHELVNDRVGGTAVLITYCPLCGTGMAFDALIQGARFLFGVSGKLYNSNVLFYDKKTESLWSQLKIEAVAGQLTGTRLSQIPLHHTTWGEWLRMHPETEVLSIKTGYLRDYIRLPYSAYERSNILFFPVAHEDQRLPRKTWVVGITLGGKAKAYSFDRLANEESPLEDTVGDEEITIHFDTKNREAVFYDQKGKEIPSVSAYWFAWAAFYPDTGLWNSDL